MCWSSYGRNGVMLIGRGVPRNGGNGFVLERYGRNGGPVHREGCGVPQNRTPRYTVHLHCRPPLASTGYRSSILDLLQPPPVTVHPRAPVHPASTALPPATVQPALSTGSCSTTPPWATVHPALHRLLFNQPSTSYCSSSPPRGPIHPPARSIGVLFIQWQRPLLPRVPVHPTPHRELFIQTPNNDHCSSRGNIDRL